MSCANTEKSPAELWTDTPEILTAVEMFNATHPRQLIEVHYKQDLANELRTATQPPALVIGKGINSKTIAGNFQPLEYLFGELVLNRNEFYKQLLGAGNIGGKQLLLPVSFNLELLAFKKGATTPTSPLVLGMDEVEKSSLAFNKENGGKFENMGFSPYWNGEFLFQWVNRLGAGFAENAARSTKKQGKTEYPITWSQLGLTDALIVVKADTAKIDGPSDAETTFRFKYLYEPGYKSAATGRILYTPLDSASYFLLPFSLKTSLDFRYFIEKGDMIVTDSVRFAGIPKLAKSKTSAEQFLRWLFAPQNQQAILEKSHKLRMDESGFGLAGGFSSVTQITEKIFPHYYPELAGHVPPESLMSAPSLVPPYWQKIKLDFIEPWLASKQTADTFEPALSEYLGRNPDM
jgi:hypothetical protein